MTDWRSQILREFTPQVARLTLAADPDGLLVEERVLQGIHERGFELLRFDESVAFRYAYESQYRARWDREEAPDLVVVVQGPPAALDELPYDLLTAARRLSFSIGELFPSLSHRVVAALDRGDLDALYRAVVEQRLEPLGENATKDFVLRHVFQVLPELVKQPSDLLRVLLRRHHGNQRLPPSLDARLIELLRRSGSFADWPLERIVLDRTAFLAFLQERWPAFLDRLMGRATSAPRTFEVPGPVDLPLEHDDVRVFVDTLFLEGLLQPVAHAEAARLTGQWAAVGLRIDPVADGLRRLQGLLADVGASMPDPEARHQDWLAFAPRWAELTALKIDAQFDLPDELGASFVALRERLDAAFRTWLLRRYAGLASQPPDPPVMVHHVPRALARRLADGGAGKKLALVVIDGLALDQWVVVRKVLQSQRSRWRFREQTLFAWAPTWTAVSRQAIFAGKPALYFSASIHSTDREPHEWSQFWADQGLASAEVLYAKRLGNGDLGKLRELLEGPKLRVAGLVVDKVDRIMHGMQLGSAGMHNQVRQWAAGGYLAQLIDVLLEQGFAPVLTSDHGNVEASGCGRPKKGTMAEVRGQRVCVYNDERLRSAAQDEAPDALAWPSIGLPPGYLPLLAPARTAFVGEGERVVAHGGIALEELIVPFIEVDQSAT